jgi:hypothetical protein
MYPPAALLRFLFRPIKIPRKMTAMIKAIPPQTPPAIGPAKDFFCIIPMLPPLLPLSEFPVTDALDALDIVELVIVPELGPVGCGIVLEV